VGTPNGIDDQTGQGVIPWPAISAWLHHLANGEMRLQTPSRSILTITSITSITKSAVVKQRIKGRSLLPGAYTVVQPMMSW